MASYLVDTHVVLWSALEPERMSSRLRKIASSAESVLFMSSASVWEIAIKHAKGALELRDGCEAFISQCVEHLRLSVLPIHWHDCIKAAALPRHHLDPFDRMIIHHAQDRSLPILSVDPIFSKYGVKVIK